VDKGFLWGIKMGQLESRPTPMFLPFLNIYPLFLLVSSLLLMGKFSKQYEV